MLLLLWARAHALLLWDIAQSLHFADRKCYFHLKWLEAPLGRLPARFSVHRVQRLICCTGPQITVVMEDMIDRTTSMNVVVVALKTRSAQ